MTDLDFPAISQEAIGRRLYLTRHALGIEEQKAFAEAAGIANSTYNNYEKGERVPKLEYAVRLCDTYELTLDWIYRGDPSGLRYDLTNKINTLRKSLFDGA